MSLCLFHYLSIVRDLFHGFSTVLITKGAGTQGVELYLQHQLSELLITEERGLPVLLHVTDFVLCSDVWNWENVEIKQRSRWIRMFKLKIDVVHSQWSSSLPFCFCKKSIVLCNMVDLSILRGWPWPWSMVQSSLMRTLNWSLLFFSDLLRDALQQQANICKKKNNLWYCGYKNIQYSNLLILCVK